MKVIAVKSLKAAEFAARVRQLYQDQVKSQPELGTTDPLIFDQTDVIELK